MPRVALPLAWAGPRLHRTKCWSVLCPEADGRRQVGYGQKRSSAIQTVGTVPPSITYSVPVIEAARGETRKAMRSATSIGLGGAAERNAAEAFHDDLLAAVVVRTGLGREALRQCDRRLGFDPAGRNADNADSLRRHLLREGLAIGRTVPPLPQRRRSSTRVMAEGVGSTLHG